MIECIYRNKKRTLYPFQIKNFDGYWYLICFDASYNDIRKYHLNSISKIVELNETYSFDTSIIEKFDNAINAWYKPELKQIHIELFLDKTVSKFFIRKPISKTQRVVKQYEDESCEIELTVTDFMEIIPTIQKFIPYIHVIEPKELKNLLKENINTYLKNCE
jgi:predicted DNA-binding transcriptional regulator YafY